MIEDIEDDEGNLQGRALKTVWINRALGGIFVYLGIRAAQLENN